MMQLTMGSSQLCGCPTLAITTLHDRTPVCTSKRLSTQPLVLTEKQKKQN